MLPPDLLSAEAQALAAVQSAISTTAKGRWTVEFRFEGLKVLPLALRLAAAMGQAGLAPRLLFPDAGAAALAQRDGPALAARIASLADALRGPASSAAEPSQELLVLVTPSLADYDAAEKVCQAHPGSVVLLNGNLEDGAVGIGSVARQRRKGFLASWSCAYALIPLAEGALLRMFPEPWSLYRRDADGHRAVASFAQKPDAEQQALALHPDQAASMADGLQAIDRFISSLST